MSTIDLHTHTTASDGTDAPEELVRKARALGLTAVAVTDHDTMAGTAPAMAAGARLGVEVLPGIEFNTQYRDDMEESVHLLGYGADPDHPEMRRAMSFGVTARRTRNEQIAARMRSDGIPVFLEELEARNPGAVIGRPHFAQALISCGRAASVNEAFAKYLNHGEKYYVPRKHLPLPEAVRAVRAAGGTAVLAHPLQYKFDDLHLLQLVRTAAEAGAEGIEIYYSGYTPGDRETLRTLAARFGLFAAGGSDYHGARKPHIALGTGTGDLDVPEQALRDIKAHIAARRGE